VLRARLGDYHRVAGNETGALAAYQEAERLLAGKPPSAERARVLAGHARTLDLTWRTQEAVRYCEEAIGVARAVGARAEEAHALSTLGICLDYLGELDRAGRARSSYFLANTSWRTATATSGLSLNSPSTPSL
jgi:tetratricopeptide (TPR) repeat protein